MRLQYRILIALAALLVAGATFLPVPMAARSHGTPGLSPATQQTPDTVATLYPFDKAPRVIKPAFPKYPEEGRKLGIQTTVLLSVVVNEKGEATEVQPLEAPEIKLDGDKKIDAAKMEELRSLFVKSAVEAAKKWKFEAATLKGKPVPAKVAIPVRFKLH